ncbi:hypothetical protein H6P81_004072 [Aristolochia fimbriata]|uniref:Secreted protein n=1 Tax=Aristolochia fimbriata TaxID=158543 RepID=A0AAV7FGC2_ARIFI|nr:hypothetical protein H6P81_004072 [Aristolochia fimbriata]
MCHRRRMMCLDHLPWVPATLSITLCSIVWGNVKGDAIHGPIRRTNNGFVVDVLMYRTRASRCRPHFPTHVPVGQAYDRHRSISDVRFGARRDGRKRRATDPRMSHVWESSWGSSRVGRPEGHWGGD